MNRYRIPKRLRFLGPLAMIAALMLTPFAALAQSAPTDEDSTDAAPEIGVWWVEDYPPAGSGGSDLPATRPDALGLRNQLVAGGWTSRFAWGNGSAWEQDWKGRYKPGGGTEWYYIDTVDMAYFAGHGNSSGFIFGVGGRNHDDSQLHYNDCRLEWGTNDLEWVGIAACNVLDNLHRRDWAWCMNGLHLIMGFKTTMADVPHGLWFGWYIRLGYNMTQAWFKASDRLQPTGKIARVLAEERYHFYDRPNNQVGGDTWDSTYWYWDHRVGSEPARQVDLNLTNGTMPVFMTPPLSLDEAQNEWGNLGSAFNVETENPLVMMAPAGISQVTQGGEVYVSEDGQLEMDPASGLYSYTDMNNLWQEMTSTLASPSQVRAITADDARQIADNFLNSNGLMPTDAQFYEVVTDTMASEIGEPDGSGITSWQTTSTENTAWQVIYSRILTYTVPSANSSSPAETMEFSVVGPGAKLKVYVAPEAATGLAAPEQNPVIGGVGGWRQVGGSGPLSAPVAEVSVLTYDPQILALYNELEPTVALGYVPLLYNSRQVISNTVGYYELPLGTGQDQLIPVYVLSAEYNLTNGEVVTTPVYIPANQLYMAPLAQIIPEEEILHPVTVGEELVFTAADASANLSDLGYDSSLNFPLGTGDADSYLYSWYLNDVSQETRIGTGRVLTYTVGLQGDSHDEGSILRQTIILEVTDSLSPRPPSVSVDRYPLSAIPPLYLPSVVKGG